MRVRIKSSMINDVYITIFRLTNNDRKTTVLKSCCQKKLYCDALDVAAKLILLRHSKNVPTFSCNTWYSRSKTHVYTKSDNSGLNDNSEIPFFGLEKPHTHFTDY